MCTSMHIHIYTVSLSAMMVPSFTIHTTTTLPVTLEKIAVTMSILDDLAGHIVGRKGTGLCQIHDISNAKLLVYPTLVSGVHLVSARGSSRDVGDALTIISKRLARRRVRTPKKKTPSAPATSTSTAPEGSLPSTSPSATIHPMQVRASQTTPLPLPTLPSGMPDPSLLPTSLPPPSPHSDWRQRGLNTSCQSRPFRGRGHAS